jgi:hypothetical protein
MLRLDDGIEQHNTSIRIIYLLLSWITNSLFENEKFFEIS